MNYLIREQKIPDAYSSFLNLHLGMDFCSKSAEQLKVVLKPLWQNTIRQIIASMRFKCLKKATTKFNNSVYTNRVSTIIRKYPFNLHLVYLL